MIRYSVFVITGMDFALKNKQTKKQISVVHFTYKTNTTRKRNPTPWWFYSKHSLQLHFVGSYSRGKQMCDVIVVEQQKAATIFLPTVNATGFLKTLQSFQWDVGLALRPRCEAIPPRRIVFFGRLIQINLIPHKLLLCHENCPVSLNSYW